MMLQEERAGGVQIRVPDAKLDEELNKTKK
jgi:hypothetical protein